MKVPDLLLGTSVLAAGGTRGGEEAPRGSPVLRHLPVWVEDSCQHCPPTSRAIPQVPWGVSPDIPHLTPPLGIIGAPWSPVVPMMKERVHFSGAAAGPGLAWPPVALSPQRCPSAP